MHEFQEVKKKSSEEGDNEMEEVEKHPGGEACEEETLFGNIVLVLEPVLFAFAIEFVLIGELEQNVKLEGKLLDFCSGATVFTNMWHAVGEAGSQHGDGKVVMVPHIRFTSIQPKRLITN